MKAMSEQCLCHDGADVIDPAEQRCLDSFLDSATRLYLALDRQLLVAHDVTFFDARLLQVLDAAPDGRLRVGDLAAELMLSRSRVSQQVRRMAAAGLLHRSTSPDDRRGVVVTITDTGRRRAERVLVTFGNLVRTHYLGPLSRAQVIALGHSCARVSSGLKAGQPAAVLSGVQ
ncbi:hypothetical protein C1Y40_04782 [Mycobacterium talmoniae]|uniref:HTH marR-type domain-containing protein n=2 Tax=Mycobacterium talmoniae TaxID=1858794 RepID=A0A2S8BEI8_9MYCO|nr:hypothetical protein C1Y40_04782 [Mycobacterium talmoniae]